MTTRYDSDVYLSASACNFVTLNQLLLAIMIKAALNVVLQILAQIEPYVYEWTSKHKGSISAEHGLGLMKANKIHYSKSPETVCGFKSYSINKNFH